MHDEYRPPIATGHAGPRAWLFAALLGRCAGRHDRLVAARKRALFAELHGNVLEIGAGTGPNLAHLPAGIRYTGLEPNPHLHAAVRRAARGTRIDATLVRGLAEAQPFESASYDAVVSTLVLCSVPDVPRVLAEVRRVLRPGGRFVFLEHVGAPRGSRLRSWQRRVRPFTRFCADGCEPDRDLAGAVEAAGFERIEIEHFEVDLPLIRPHVAGTAWR